MALQSLNGAITRALCVCWTHTSISALSSVLSDKHSQDTLLLCPYPRPVHDHPDLYAVPCQ